MDPQVNYLKQQAAKQERAREKEANKIAGELLSMGTEEEQRLKVMSAELKAGLAESKKTAGGSLSQEEQQLIDNAEKARKDFSAWKKRYDELSARLEELEKQNLER